MRIVLKPMGVVLLLAVIAGLVILPRLLTGTGKSPASTLGYGMRPTTSATPIPTTLPKAAGGGSSENLLAGTSWAFWTQSGAVGQYTALPPGQDGHTLSWRYTIETPGRQIFHAGFNTPLQNIHLKAGDKVTVRFAARSAENIPICVVLQRNAPPFPPGDRKWVKLTPEWENYEVTLAADNYGPGEALLSYMFGEKKGTIEIADPVLSH